MPRGFKTPKPNFTSRKANKARRKRRESLMAKIIEVDEKAKIIAKRAENLRKQALEKW